MSSYRLHPEMKEPAREHNDIFEFDASVEFIFDDNLIFRKKQEIDITVSGNNWVKSKKS